MDAVGIGAGGTAPALPNTWVGVDLGTSWAKAAAWGPEGHRVAQARVPMPPVQSGVQDALGVREAGEAVVRALGISGPIRLAWTTQRDTVVLVDADGVPVSPLLSWRVRGDGRWASRWADRWADRPRDPSVTTTSLEGWVAEIWREGIPGLDLTFGQCTHAGGDKNCEYHGLGVGLGAPGVAGLSFGSAIAMGMAIARGGRGARGAVEVEDRVGLPAGVVRSSGVGATGEPVWHLETGILSGMGGLNELLAALGFPPWEGPLPELRGDRDPGLARLRCVPHFGGALDDLGARPRLLLVRDEVGGGEVDLLAEGALQGGDDLHTVALDAAEVARAWVQGVVAELARLRPGLEAAAGHPLAELRVAGGGVQAGDWGPHLARALGVRVRIHDDAWLGCRGAVLIAGARGLEPLTFSEVTPHG